MTFIHTYQFIYDIDRLAEIAFSEINFYKAYIIFSRELEQGTFRTDINFQHTSQMWRT